MGDGRKAGRGAPKRAPKIRGPVRVTKGGDGGLPVADFMLHRGSYGCDGLNALRVLCALRHVPDRAERERAEARLVESPDPFDVAHDDRDQAGAFLEQCSRDGAPRPGLAEHPRRLVHRGEVGPDGRTWEQVFADHHERRRWIERQLGMQLPAEGFVVQSILGRVLPAGATGHEARSMLHQRTSQAMRPTEVALHREASRLLKRARNSPNPSAEQ